MDRPPPDPTALRTIWMEWESGESPPGSVMSRLKTGGMRELLDSLAAQASADAPSPAGPEGEAAGAGA